MMEFEKDISDEQLDALLRDVEIPDDLLDSLRDIPETTTGSKSQSKQNGASPRIRFWLAIAASVLALTSIAIWMVSRSGDLQIAEDENTTTDEQNSDVTNNEKWQVEIVKANDRVAVLENALHQVEMQQLRSRLQQLQTRNTDPVGDDDVTSLILAIAGHSSDAFGSSKERTTEHLISVIDQYPDSRGAKLAAEFLNQIQ